MNTELSLKRDQLCTSLDELEALCSPRDVKLLRRIHKSLRRVGEEESSPKRARLEARVQMDVDAIVRVQMDAREPVDAIVRVQMDVDAIVREPIDAIAASVQIVPYPWQLEHVDRMVASIRDHGVAYDLSATGKGKTVTAIEVCKRSFDGIFSIYPAGALEVKWPRMCKRQGVPMLGQTSWHGICGTIRSALAHPWLDRVDQEVEYAIPHRGAPASTGTRIETVFQATPALLSLLRDQRILLVLDEGHAAKNGGLRARAVASLLQAMNQASSARRHGVLIMSGSLIDKPEHAVAMLQISGALPCLIDARNRLFKTTRNDLGHSCLGIDKASSFYETCKAIDMDVARSLYRKYISFPVALPGASGTMSTTERGSRFVYDLFALIIIPTMSSAMLDPIKPLYTLDIANCHYRFDTPDQVSEYVLALGELTSARALRENAIGQGASAEALAAITKAMRVVEVAKRSLFVRAARDQLEHDPHCKVVIGLNYTSTVDYCMSELSAFEPMRMSGQPALSAASKMQLCDNFLDNQYIDGVLQNRVIVAIMTVISEGLDLHDTRGANARHTFGSASFRPLLMHQFNGRTAREGTKGTVRVRWVYGRVVGDTRDDMPAVADAQQETRVLESLARKALVMKSVAKDQVADGVLFVDSYPVLQETLPKTFRSVTHAA